MQLRACKAHPDPKADLMSPLGMHHKIGSTKCIDDSATGHNTSTAHQLTCGVNVHSSWGPGLRCLAWCVLRKAVEELLLRPWSPPPRVLVPLAQNTLCPRLPACPGDHTRCGGGVYGSPDCVHVPQADTQLNTATSAHSHRHAQARMWDEHVLEGARKIDVCSVIITDATRPSLWCNTRYITVLYHSVHPAHQSLPPTTRTCALLARMHTLPADMCLLCGLDVRCASSLVALRSRNRDWRDRNSPKSRRSLMPHWEPPAPTELAAPCLPALSLAGPAVSHALRVEWEGVVKSSTSAKSSALRRSMGPGPGGYAVAGRLRL